MALKQTGMMTHHAVEEHDDLAAVAGPILDTVVDVEHAVVTEDATSGMLA